MNRCSLLSLATAVVITFGFAVGQIRRESGARIGGTLFSDALSLPDDPAPTHLDMFRHNVRTLSAALSS